SRTRRSTAVLAAASSRPPVRRLDKAPWRWFPMQLLIHRAVIIADVECSEVEGFSSFGLPQAQQVCGGHAIAWDRSVVRDTLDHLLRNPAHSIAAPRVVIGLGVAAELHIEGDLRAHDLPRISKAQPLIRELDLPPITNRLIENAELVTDAVADGRN